MEHQIEVVETAYEFLLAYAAQGREDDTEGPGRKSREVLEELDRALDEIEGSLGNAEPFHEVVASDIGKTRKALRLVLAQPRISSELVDNLNASMHLRAVLTDLFLLSEAARISG
ncbi:MAG: hypothetical protein P8Y69_06220 [Gammaproteobacteria bacterium]|jgi:hypothetical protein